MKYNGNHIKASTVYEAQALTRMTNGLVRFIVTTTETIFENAIIPKGIIVDFVDKTKDGWIIRPFCNYEWFQCIPYSNGKEVS